MGATTDSDLVEAVAERCRQLPGFPDLEAPDGYPDSLALCIIDAIWSMGVRYRGVENVISRYRAWLESGGRGRAAGRSSADLADDIRAVGGGAAFAQVVGNRCRTSSRNGILKAEAVLIAAERLAGLAVLSTSDLRRRHSDMEVKKVWSGVHGQRSGISWHYLLILVGVEDIKADRMICRFVQEAAGSDRAVGTDDAYRAMKGAYTILHREAPALSLRRLDHTVWNYQRRR